MWKKQRKLIINCVRTTADKCELMHKTQAELIPNISVTRGELCGFSHTVSSWRASVARGGGGGGGGDKEREKKRRKSFHLTGVPMVCHAGG